MIRALVKAFFLCSILLSFLVVPCLGADEDELPQWKCRLEDGNLELAEFTQAISGKPIKADTEELLKGVVEVHLKPEYLEFRRSDNEQLRLYTESPRGIKMREDWNKAVKNAEERFGPSGRAFLESIAAIRLVDNHIEVDRTGPEEFVVEMGEKTLHRAFDLKALRFKKIRLNLDKSSEHTGLKDIDGVTVVVGAPGLSLPVEVKEFRRFKNDQGDTDVRVGVKNPVPGPLRTLFAMPQVLSFHFVLPKKKKRARD